MTINEQLVSAALARVADSVSVRLTEAIMPQIEQYANEVAIALWNDMFVAIDNPYWDAERGFMSRKEALDMIRYNARKVLDEFKKQRGIT